MALFEPAIQITLINEGGLEDDPSDPGGVTKYGISQRSYPSLDVRSLTVDQAKAIYLQDFWLFGGIQDQSVANKLFDMYVNMKHTAIRLAQKVVAVPEDGLYGPKTEGAINQKSAFLIGYKDVLITHYTDLVKARPELGKYLVGWLRRARQ